MGKVETEGSTATAVTVPGAGSSAVNITIPADQFKPLSFAVVGFLIVILFIGVIAAYAVIEAHAARRNAIDTSMWADLAYAHLMKEDAYLRAHDIPVDSFGVVPKPKENEE